MDEVLPSKREFMTRTAALLASLGLVAVAGEGCAATPTKPAAATPIPFPLDYPATGPMPRRQMWLGSSPPIDRPL